ncbi:EamA family transporter [Pendulispora rubella]|uniref:EamA family transporter n=1 Tax=Pendulispora rubella TaxID=2741070 RepID=A0ABZ2KPF3_9BACT
MSASHSRSSPPKALLIAAFAAVYFIWGSTFLGIRFAVETLPPFLVASLQFLVAGIVLYAWARLRGTPAPTLQNWYAAAVVGILMLSAGVGGITWAERSVPSSLAALLIASVPLWMMLLEWLHYGGARPKGKTAIGLAIGFCGVGVLVTSGTAGDGHFDLAGTVVLLLASLSWAEGSLYSRRAKLPSSPLLGTAMQMCAGGALLLLASGVTGELVLDFRSRSSITRLPRPWPPGRTPYRSPLATR